jgi:hypothetical protein
VKAISYAWRKIMAAPSGTGDLLTMKQGPRVLDDASEEDARLIATHSHPYAATMRTSSCEPRLERKSRASIARSLQHASFTVTLRVE